MCKLAKIGPGCPAINWMGDCTVYHPEGVLAREQRFGSCGYRNARTPDPLAKKRVIHKINPIKASKAKAKG
jgi:hypothetical protein